MKTKTRTFDFADLSNSPVAVHNAQLAWDAGYMIEVTVDAPEPYRTEVERWLIQNGIAYQKVRMLG